MQLNDSLDGHENHEIANLFPMMQQDEFDGLKQDISANGLRTPVLLYENKILDGRNRYAACRQIGVKPDTIEYVGNYPVGHVISLNLVRRHLNTSQRAMISLRIAHYKNGGIRTGQNTLASQTANLPLAISQSEVAKLLNISPRIIKSAINLKRRRIMSFWSRLRMAHLQSTQPNL